MLRAISTILLGGFLFDTSLPLAGAIVSSPLFDKPLDETHTQLPLDPDNPQSKPVLSCFYYPGFMVKQVDLGDMGAEQLSILPRAKGSAEPQCLRANAKDEIVIGPKEWGGYFEGVKGSFVFFHAEDGFYGGLDFGVFSADGRKLFEDLASLDKSGIAFTTLAMLSDPKNETDPAIILRYRRVYAAQCSLRADEKACWSEIRKITGLPQTAPPSCTAAYEAEKKRLPEYANKVDSYPSVITYEVEVVLNERNPVMRVAPVSKTTECYLGD